MKTVFLTGATGFIGKHVVDELLRRGCQIRCLVRATSDIQHLHHENIERVQGTLANPAGFRESLIGCDTVLHLGGLVTSATADELNAINGIACGGLADLCCELSPPPRFVYVSSLAAAGPPPPGKELREEEDLPQPISHYGRSKRLGEVQLQQRADRLPITVIRPGIVYGPGDKTVAVLFRSIYRTRVHVIVGFRTPPLSLVYVADLVDMILAAAQSGETLAATPEGEYSPRGYYQACDDAEFPDYREFGQRIAAALDRRVLVWPLWRWVGRGVGLTVENASRLVGRSSFLTLDKVREATVPSWASSSEKARQQLGFLPPKPLDSRLRETAEWFRDHGWL